MKKSLVAALAGLAIAGLALSGCSSSGSSSGGDHPLVIAMPNGTQTENSNPFLGTSSGASLGYRWMIYEPVVQYNTTNPSQDPEPWLASAYKWNDDYTAITLTPRDGAKWSDGKDITADDYVYTFELLKKTPALNSSNLPITDVTDNGDGTVTVNFEKSQFVRQQFVYQTFIVPEHVWKDVADPTTDLNKKPVGSGPYTLTSWTNQAITLTARDDYWGGDVPIKTLQYKSYSGNDTLIPALTTSAVQWAWTFIPDFENVYIAKDPKNNLAYFPAGLGIDALFLNTQTKPFNDVALRKAVNMVVDREQISTVAESGVFPELTSVTGIPTPAGDKFIADQYQGVDYKVDVDGAKKVLADAGYTLDAGVLKDPSGTVVTFSLTNPTGWSDYLTSLQLVADAVKPLGITATVDPMAQDPWFDAIAQGNFQASNHWTDGGATPYDIYSNIMSGDFYVPIGETANWNFGRFQSDAATAALNTFATSTDTAEQKAAMDQLQQVFVDEVPAIAMDARPSGAEFSQKYWTGWPSEKDPYANPQPTQPSASLIVMKLKASN